MPFFHNSSNFNVSGSTFIDIAGNINVHDIQASETGIIRLLNNIHSSALHDSAERSPHPRCHPGTRKDVLARILEEKENNILWLEGPAGAGKSAIAQSVAEKRELMVASFFFSRGPGQCLCNTAKLLWATIAYQIAMLMPQHRSGIESAVEDNPDIFIQPPDIQLQTLIIQPLTSALSITQLSRQLPILVVIDGLDECKSHDEQSVILLSIARIITFHRLPLRFLVTSRPDPHICTFFANLKHTFHYHIPLDSRFRPVQDVYLFLRSEFENIYQKHLPQMGSVPTPWPTEDVVRDLALKSRGQFIYASTLLKFIDDDDCRPTDQLKLVLDGSASTELDLLYKSIPSTCTNMPLLLRVLGCILILKERLSCLDLEILLSLQQGDVDLILRRMHSILQVPGDPTQPILVHHTSVADFIFNEDRSGTFYVNQQLSHLDIARGCLECLQKRSVKINWKGSQPRTQEYAVCYWAWHCSQAKAHVDLYNSLTAIVGELSSFVWPEGDTLYGHAYKLSVVIQWLQNNADLPIPGDLVSRLISERDGLYRQILSMDHRHVIPLYFTLFEHMDYSSAGVILNVGMWTLESLLEGVGYGSRFGVEVDNDPLCGFLKDKARCGQYFVDPMLAHAQLAGACITLLKGYDSSRKYFPERQNALQYAKKYWHKHLVQTSSGDSDLWHDLEWLATSFHSVGLPAAQAHPVFRWLELVATFSDSLPRDLLSQWEKISRHAQNTTNLAFYHDTSVPD